jgi:type VI secretion system VasD/TssJ family lipoprotein
MKTSMKLLFSNGIRVYVAKTARARRSFLKQHMACLKIVVASCFVFTVSSCASQPGQVSPSQSSGSRVERDADRAERASRDALDSERKASLEATRAEAAAKRAEEAAAKAEAAARMSFERPPERSGYESGTVRLHIKADPQLNFYQGGPHTLFLCLYHLKDTTMFNQLVDEKDGPSKLLECSRFDSSVVKSKGLIIQPNQELTESLARVEGAQHVGIIAGYYNNFRKERVVRSFRIPMIEDRIGSTFVQKLGTLNVDLYLGPQEMKEMREK